MALTPPSLISLASGSVASPAIQAALRAQDKHNLDVSQALSPLTSPIVWNALTPSNGWLWALAPYTKPAYRIDAQGHVWLKGRIKSGSTGVNLFTVALSSSPADQHSFPVITDTGIGELDILRTGHLQLVSGGTGFLSLDGIHFQP